MNEPNKGNGLPTQLPPPMVAPPTEHTGQGVNDGKGPQLRSPNAATWSANPATSDTLSATTPQFDKVWVEKLQAVVAQTRQDPYQQHRQISKLRASFLKQRYGKDVETED